jgi:ABC-type Fe3+-siderophore transport system permease subunit
MWEAYDTSNPSKKQLVVVHPIATCVEASLAVAGALMQALTRNPLASPGIFGINAGGK